MLKVCFLGLMPLSAMGQAPSGDVQHPSESISSFSSIMDATEAVADRPFYEAVLIIDQEPRPEDNGGNVFLAGFLEIDENGYPGTGLIPSDYQQLGVWVQTWPYRREVQLVAGLHYYIQYGYSETPVVDDRVSRSFSVDSQPVDPIHVTIAIDEPFGYPRAQDSGPGRDPALMAVSVERRLTVNFDPPVSETGGSIFLTGFESLDETTGMPSRESDPIDFNIVKVDFSGAQFDDDVFLVPGLHYFAMYGNGVHPEPEDRMSTGVLFSEEDASLTLNIGDLATPSEDDVEEGQPPPVTTVNQASAVPQPQQPSAPSTPMMFETMVRSHVKKWAGISLLSGLFLGGFIGWFLRGRIR